MSATLEQFYLFLRKIPTKMKGRKVDLTFDRGMIRGKRIKVFEMNKLKDFYSYYNSGHFNDLGFQLYFLENYALEDDFLMNLRKWNARNVKSISIEQISENIKKDQEFIIQVCKKSNVKDLKVLFDINTDGESLISSFYEQKLISIYFLARYSMYFAEDIYETDKHKKLVKISKIIQEIIQKYKEK